MSEVEKQILAENERWKKTVNRFTKKLKDLRSLLGNSCTHSSKRWGKWEHDNGYGRQTWLKDWVCNACLHEEKTYERAEEKR